NFTLQRTSGSRCSPLAAERGRSTYTRTGKGYPDRHGSGSSSMSRDGSRSGPGMTAGSALGRGVLHLGTAALIVFASPPIANPQPRTTVRRIVELNPSAGPQEQQRVFRQALRDLGYIQGEHIMIEGRFGDGSEERLREYAAEAVRLQTDVIVAISSSAI